MRGNKHSNLTRGLFTLERRREVLMKKAKVVVSTLSTWCRANQHSISLA